MARISIVGGNGLTAHHLISRLTGRGDDVLAFIRDPGQATVVRDLGATPVVLDLATSTVDDYADAFRASDAVVFAAGVGSGGGDLKVVDLGGSRLSVDAAVRAGVPRFIQISAIGASGRMPSSLSGPFWEGYYEAKRGADAHLRQSGLAWTILEPGALTEELATDTVRLGSRGRVASDGDGSSDRVASDPPIARADVAAVIVAVLAEPRSAGHTWELVGGTTPVEEAVAQAVEVASVD